MNKLPNREDQLTPPNESPLERILRPNDANKIPPVSSDDFEQHYRDTGRYLVPPSVARVAQIVTNALGKEVTAESIPEISQQSRTATALTPNLEILITYLYEPILIHAFVVEQTWTNCERLTHQALVRVSVEANAGVLECLNWNRLDEIQPEQLRTKYLPRCLRRCRQILEQVARRDVQRRQREGAKDDGHRHKVENDAQMVVQGVFHRLSESRRKVLLVSYYADRHLGAAAELFGEAVVNFRDRLLHVEGDFHSQLIQQIPEDAARELSRKMLVDVARMMRESVQSVSNIDCIIEDVCSRISGTLSPRLEQPLALGVARLRRRTLKTRKRQIQRLLKRKVATLAEKYHATSAWLFIRYGNDTFRADITHNTSQVGLEMPLAGKPETERGIVAYVARNQSGVCLPDVRRDPLSKLYEATSKSTQSEIAVPITVSWQDPSVIAVLNLESAKVDKFSWSQIESLQADVTELIPDLLCLTACDSNAVDAWGWHPSLDGWSIQGVLQRICDTIVESSPTEETDSVTATLWDIDWPKDVLWVLATSGYDFQFETKPLSIKSLSGDVGEKQRGRVIYDAPDSPIFVEWRKADDMGLTYVCSTPIYRPASAEGERAIGVLNVYLLSELYTRLIPSRDEMARLAELVGAAIDALERLRVHVGIEYLRSKLKIVEQLNPFPQALVESQMATIKEVICECMRAGGGSLFLNDKTRLVLAQTTGLRHYQGSLTVRQREVFYDCENADDRGIMTYLGTHPGSCVRKHNANDLSEQGVPEDLPQQVVMHKNMEHLTPRDTNERRFLGASISDNSMPLGVVRVVRPEDGLPFTRADEVLFRQLCEACRDVFQVASLDKTISVDANAN